MSSEESPVRTYRSLLPGLQRYGSLKMKAPLMLACLLLLASLAGCAPATTPADSKTVPTTPPKLTVTLGADAIEIPAGIGAGVVELTMNNVDKETHTGLLRQLNAGQTLEEFRAAFEQDPRSTRPMTKFLGGPDVPPGASISSYYTLDPGTYIVVDNLAEPWHYATFTVMSAAKPATLPPAAVRVKMREYAYDMPDSIPSGKRLWEFSNAGQSLHHLGIIQVNEGTTVESAVAWMKDPQGDPPGKVLAWWNMLSPGVTSQAEIELPTGKYYAVDMLPDFVSDGVTNADHGMVKAFTVTQ